MIALSIGIPTLAAAQGPVAGAVILLLMIVLLIAREVTSAAPLVSIRQCSQLVDVAIIPIAAAFLLLVVFEIVASF